MRMKRKSTPLGNQGDKVHPSESSESDRRGRHPNRRRDEHRPGCVEMTRIPATLGAWGLSQCSTMPPPFVLYFMHFTSQ